MRNSKARASEDDYMAWLLSELPVHKATSYKSYVDDSAWMANLWIGWALEFFVELFALLISGKDSKSSSELAYSKTLKGHHNFFQSTAFNQALKKMPTREQILERLQGAAKQEDLLREISAFVASGRTIVKYCIMMNDKLDARLTEER